MRFLIVSSAPLIPKGTEWQAYTPYAREIIYWEKYVDEIQFCNPVWQKDRGLLVEKFPFDILYPISLIEFEITSIKAIPKAIWGSIVNSYRIYNAMKRADHIHLRCPGNMGLLGCIVQIGFPSKPKTAKYAGNWDPKSKQPWTYKLQKWILGNTFLTKNMQVLVYGEWEKSTKNIKPFFTATYRESDKKTFDFTQDRRLELLNTGTIRFLFVGTLSQGKRPLYAIQLVEQLYKKGQKVQLQLFGEGKERVVLEEYIHENQLGDIVVLKGNQATEMVKDAYQKSHFLILPSKSEGWPKVVAEAMFWGCLPIATPVSCVSNMLNDQKRGILLSLDLKKDLDKIEVLISNPDDYKDRSTAAIAWSQGYTVEKFEQEIAKLLI